MARLRHGRRLALAAAAAVPLVAANAHAHGFGARYDLPLPLEMYLVAAGLVVGLSFVLAAVATRGAMAAGGRRAWPRLRAGRGGAAAALTLRALGLALFALVVVAGLVGDQSPIRNIAPTLVWVLWWVGLVFVCVLIANPWPLLNPWASLYDLGAWAWTRLAGRPPRPPLGYPDWLGVWPAVALFYGFVWIELIWTHSEAPAALACVILGYTALTLAAMAAFGRDAWLGRGEAFTLAFSVFGRFAPIAAAPPRADGGIEARPHGAGLLLDEPATPSMVCFVVLMLSTVTFDGLMETPLWAGLVDAAFKIQALAPVLFAMRDLFGSAVAGLETVALALFPVLVLGFFFAFISIMARITPLADSSLWALAGWFAFSLVPISVGYHFAHYLSFLAIAGQLSISLASDPLGLGWDLFGTARYRLDVGVINARVVWYVAVATIVTGHVIAVVVAHMTALRLFATRAAAALSQAPMLVLMVCYTMLSLWILAQPIVQ